MHQQSAVFTNGVHAIPVPVVKSNSLESLCSSTADTTPLSGNSSLSQNEDSILKTPVKNELPSTTSTLKSPSCRPFSLVSDSKLHLLWPQPQQLIQFNTGNLILQSEIQVQIVPCKRHANENIQDIMEAWLSYEEQFKRLNYSLHVHPAVSSVVKRDINIDFACQINPALLTKSESYSLTANSNELKIVANGLPGLHHAVRTLLQLLALYRSDEGIPALYIHDWPDLPCRALLLNLSLDAARTFSFETLKHLIDSYARLKFNQLHLYVKFSPRDDWQLPYSQMELLELVEFCKVRAISIIPALDVGSDVNIHDLGTVYLSIQQFLVSLGNYEYVHIGSNLGKILIDSSKCCIQRIWQYLPLDQDQAIFISSETISHFHNVPFNVIPVNSCCQIGSEENYMPISQLKMGCCSAIRVEAATTYCITGCPKTTISNIYKQIQTSACYRNLALIVGDAEYKKTTDCMPLSFILPGMLVALGLAWNSDIHQDYLEFQVPQLLNKHIVLDTEEVTGQVIIELGRAEKFVQRAWSDNSLDNSQSVHSVLWQFLVQPDEMNLENLTVDTFQKAMRHIKHCQQQLHRTKLCCFQSGELVAELQLAVDLLLLSCRIGRSLVSLGLNPIASFGVSVINAGVNNLPPTARTDLANKLLGLTEQFRAIWLSRHLASGLHAPLLLFTSLLQKLVPDETNGC